MFLDIVIAPIKVICENVCIIPEANIPIMNLLTSTGFYTCVGYIKAEKNNIIIPKWKLICILLTFFSYFVTTCE